MGEQSVLYDRSKIDGAMALGRKTGGRKKGTPNRRTLEAIELAQAGGEMPLGALLRKMHYWLGIVDEEEAKGPAGNRQVLENAFDRVQEAAVAAAPFCHAKLTAQAVVQDTSEEVRSRFSGARERLAQLLEQELAGDEKDEGRLPN